MWFSQGVQYTGWPSCHVKKKYESVGKGTDFGALLTDLSKEFDFIDPKLLIAKIILVLESHLRHLI